MATLSLISGQRPSKATAKRKSSCKGCKGDIPANDDFFAIPDRYVRGHFTSKKRYCKKCFKKILDKTQKDLDEYTKDISS